MDAGCNVNAQNSSGESPLLLASIEGHTRAVQLIIERGTDPLSEKSTILLDKSYIAQLRVYCLMFFLLLKYAA